MKDNLFIGLIFGAIAIVFCILLYGILVNNIDCTKSNYCNTVWDALGIIPPVVFFITYFGKEIRSSKSKQVIS